MTSPAPDWLMIAGGALADLDFVLQKAQRDGGLSLWAGRPSDGSREQQIEAAARALPIPNGKVRVARVADLESLGWDLVHCPDEGADDPARHYDAVYGAGQVDREAIKAFIGAFDQPIPNRWRQR